MSDTTRLVDEWIEEARALGREHGPNGPTSDDGPHDIIDLNAWSALAGEDISYGELADVQTALAAAYEDGLKEAYPYSAFTLTLELGNDAMREPEHIADALRRVAQMIENSHGAEGSIMDNNGSTVGKFQTT